MRLVQSRALRHLLPGALAVAAAVGLLAAQTEPAPAETRLEVDISERKLIVHHGGQVMNTFQIAVGTAEHPTPRGEFAIDRINWDPSWVPPDSEWAEGETRKEPADPENPMEAAKLFFEYPAYYVHGTNATHTLGKAESHGCIRMNPADVEALAEFVQRHGGEPRSDGWFERVKRQEEPTTEITLPNPVPITIHD